MFTRSPRQKRRLMRLWTLTWYYKRNQGMDYQFWRIYKLRKPMRSSHSFPLLTSLHTFLSSLVDNPMEEARAGELVFVPTPGMGHLISTVEIAKLLIQRDDRLSITVLIMNNPFDSKLKGYAQSLSSSSSSSNRIRFIDLPAITPTTEQAKSGRFMGPMFEAHKPQVTQILTDLAKSGTRLAGFVLDMFCTTFIDVANHFGVPSYIFFTSGAAFLDFMFLLQQLNDVQGVDTTALKPDATVALPSFANPLPVKAFPSVALNKEWLSILLGIFRKFKEAKGIVVNTFLELESRAVQALLGNSEMPPVYPVGPVLNLNPADENKSSSSIMEWLDEQPRASVVFLCFGSMGSFDGEQVLEIARALEKSGHRFLWSLRKPQPKGVKGIPTEYTDFQEVLPEGFLERTANVGKVIGWAPQVGVLAHPAVGGFVSHCGWNSTLESIWSGVPIAAWPLYAEQQLNAFALVVELGLAEEIQMDYRREVFVEADDDAANIVSAERIESGIRKVMEVESEVRRKVKEMSEASKNALVEGGSSYISLGRFIDSVMLKMP